MVASLSAHDVGTTGQSAQTNGLLCLGTDDATAIEVIDIDDIGTRSQHLIASEGHDSAAVVQGCGQSSQVIHIIVKNGANGERHGVVDILIPLSSLEIAPSAVIIEYILPSRTFLARCTTVYQHGNVVAVLVGEATDGDEELAIDRHGLVKVPHSLDHILFVILQLRSLEGALSQHLTRHAIGIGSLLLNGIGDTIRVSLSGDPVPEAKAGWDILRALNLRTRGVQLIACPTCGRTGIPVAEIAARVERELGEITVPLKVAVMGCVVNGIGEGKEADIGIAGGGNGSGVLFRKGREPEKVTGDLAEILIRAVRDMIG